jgi:UMF1 family MFS transporter
MTPPAAPASPTAAPAAATPRQRLAWALYDWANSPFFAVIITFVFAAYFTQAVAPDPVTGTAWWGWAMTGSALVIAVSAPVMGAIADAGGPRKPWLAACTAVGAVATIALWWVRPDPAWVALAIGLVVVANIAAEIGQSFYNAMLPDIAPPARLGRWSGWGWALGYVAGIVALGLLLVLFVQRDPPAFGLDREAAEHIRVTGPVIGLWLVLFALPLFLLTPDRRATGRPLGSVVGTGLARLAATLRGLRREPDLVRFLVARLVYNDGLNTLFAFGGIYAAGTFGMDTGEIILFGIALNLTAGLGAFAFGFADDRIGSRPTILIAILGLFLCGLLALLATEKATFWGTALALGVFIGPAQSASRTLMARLSPPERTAELFGIYALTGKVTAFVGPFLFGTATLAFETQRAGMAVILVMFVIGGLLLWRVREPGRG